VFPYGGRQQRRLVRERHNRLATEQVASYSALASLGQVTRARICQIMNLLQLAPDIQEALLFLPRTERGRDPIILADLQPIAATFDWVKQRRLWRQLLPGEAPTVECRLGKKGSYKNRR
jgi:hypothetical protein